MTIASIRLARLSAGIFQWQLAKAIGVSESQLSKYETGRETTPEEVQKKVVKALKNIDKKSKK